MQTDELVNLTECPILSCVARFMNPFAMYGAAIISVSRPWRCFAIYDFCPHISSPASRYSISAGGDFQRVSEYNFRRIILAVNSDWLSCVWVGNESCSLLYKPPARLVVYPGFVLVSFSKEAPTFGGGVSLYCHALAINGWFQTSLRAWNQHCKPSAPLTE